MQEFVKTYKKRFNETPDGLAALGYDAAKVLIDAMQKANSLAGPDLQTVIAKTSSFPGVTGKITLDAKRNPVKSAVVLKVAGKDFKYETTVNPM